MKPVGAPLVGGMITSTIQVLILVPVFFVIMKERALRKGHLRPTETAGDYLAAERTFLAWIRTGLALMGFGFVVARFGLFLQRLRFIDQAPPDHRTACRCGSVPRSLRSEWS